MSYFVVTTCSASGWEKYGRRMLDSFVRNWPSDVNLVIYTEGFRIPSHSNVIEAHFPPWFFRWRLTMSDRPAVHGRDPRRNRRRQGYDFRQDCVRFSHKIAAVTDAGGSAEDSDVLIWIDADTVTHAPVDEAWLERLFPVGPDGSRSSYMAWLDRRGTYPECGFVMYDCSHPRHADFMGRLAALYEGGDVFKMKETHDSYVVQQLVSGCMAAGWFPEPVSLSGPLGRMSGHPFVVGPLGSRMDHLKGKRKNLGRTPRSEAAKAKHREDYWR